MTDLFEYAVTRKLNTPDMHRKDDHQSSIDASARIVRSCRSELQTAIHQILIEHGPMTDGELEALPCFAMYGPSTVRKRRSELFQDGRVAQSGERRDHMNVWRAVR